MAPTPDSARFDDALLLILTTELLPTVRRIVADLGGDEPDSLVHARPTSQRETNSVAAIIHHRCGTLSSWGQAGLGGEQITRNRPQEFAFTGPVLPEIERLEGLIGRLPVWADTARARGHVADPTGTSRDLGEFRESGGLTVEWVLLHILHEVAQHTGQMEITRDALLSR